MQKSEKLKELGLTKEQERRLTAIGINWKSRRNTTWEKSYQAACNYYKEYHNLDVPAAYLTEDGFRLGRWIRQQREKYKKIAVKLQKEGRSTEEFSNLYKEQEQNVETALDKKSIDQIKRLEQIGMNWGNRDSWEQRFELAKKYYEKHGNLEIPGDCVVEGVWLGRWLNEQKLKFEGKREKTLTKEQETKLSSIGVGSGLSRSEMTWRRQYKEAEEFYQTHGNLSIPKRYIGKSGKNLGAWIQHQRANYRSGLLADWQIALLNQIGMVWELEDPWKVGFLYAKKFFQETGHLEVPYHYVNKEGYHNLSKKSLRTEQIHQLEKIDMVWNAKAGKKRKLQKK